MTDGDDLALLRARVARLEAQLEEQARDRAIARAVLETVPAVVLRISVDGTIDYVNRVLPNYESRPPRGQSIYSFAPADQHDVMRAALEFVRANKAPSSYESIALAPDGTRDWYWTVVAPILEDDELAGMTLVCTNITRLKSAELALVERNQRLALALDAGNVGVWRWDAMVDRVDWDDKLCAMFGLRPEEAPRTRETFLGLVSEEQRLRLAAHIDAALASGDYPDFELRVDAGGGETRLYILKGGVVRDAAGKITGLLGGVVDDTERYRLVERARETQRLEALGQLSAGVAHNFNNMLAVLVPALQLAARESRTPIRDILEDASDTAMRAAELVKQLTRFSRRDLGEVPTESLEAVLVRSISLCRRTFGPEVTVRTRGLELARTILVDGPPMEQAVVNVLINARDALRGASARDASIDIVVEAADPSTAGEPAGVAVTISDHGLGMDDATRARIFEPFFTTKAPGEGTGLGLSTAWATLRAHGGTLSCCSTPGAGTTFSLTLPPSSSGRAPTAPSARPPSGPRGHGQTILIVDDEGSLRRSLQALLSLSGYRVIAAATGDEGVALFQREPADLVLLDHSMPGQSPEETLAQMRALASEVPIVSFSGLDVALPGASAHVRKPADSDALLTIIADLLRAAPTQ